MLFVLFCCLTCEPCRAQALAKYPDSIEGLRAFLLTYIDTIKDAESDKRARMDEGLRIPDPDKWFVATFGMKLGRAQAAKYVAEPPNLYPYLDQFDLGLTMQVNVSHVEFANERDAKSSNVPLFIAMTHPVSYYSVYLSYSDRPGALFVYPLFVYVDHAFRLIYREFGKIAENKRPSCGLEHLYRHRTFAIEESMQRVFPPGPLIPLTPPRRTSEDAAQSVKLLVLVGCDGQVLETDYLAGPAGLYGSAAGAVKQWKYAQKLLNGFPVEIVSMATVPFKPTLSSFPNPMRMEVGGPGGPPIPELIKTVSPIYPAEASEKKVQGIVRLHVILDRDGKVSQIQVVNGDPLLVSAAIEAVKQWAYKPQPDERYVGFYIDVEVKPHQN